MRVLLALLPSTLMTIGCSIISPGVVMTTLLLVAFIKRANDRRFRRRNSSVDDSHGNLPPYIMASAPSDESMWLFLSGFFVGQFECIFLIYSYFAPEIPTIRIQASENHF